MEMLQLHFHLFSSSLIFCKFGFAVSARCLPQVSLSTTADTWLTEGNSFLFRPPRSPPHTCKSGEEPIRMYFRIMKCKSKTKKSVHISPRPRRVALELISFISRDGEKQKAAASVWSLIRKAQPGREVPQSIKPGSVRSHGPGRHELTKSEIRQSAAHV